MKSVLALIVVVCGIAPPVGAQPRGPEPAADVRTGFIQGLPPLRDSLSPSAQELYDAALLLLDDQDYAGALIKFRRAFELSADVRLLWNLAVCEKGLRHYARALRLLERYRSEANARMTEAHRAELTELLDALQLLVSRVWIEVDAPDASVYVDGELLGRTPLVQAQLIDLGQHYVRVAKPGFSDALLTQELAGGTELTIRVALRPLPAPAPEQGAPTAQLAITAEASATIWIDGNNVGHERWKGELPEGQHTLRVTAPSMLEHEQTLSLRAGDSRSLRIMLKEQPATISPLLWVGAGVLVASGLAVGGYFLLRSPSEQPPYVGSLGSGSVQLPAARR